MLNPVDSHLWQKWQKPGFTPGKSDLPPLIKALGLVTEAQLQPVEKALLRAFASTPEVVQQAVLQALPEAVRPLRGRLVRLLGRMIVLRPNEGVHDLLCTLIEDPDLKTSLNAVAALGAVPGAKSEAHLLAAWQQAVAVGGMRRELRRALVRALGKAGGEKARALLQTVGPESDDPDGERLISQARLILERTAARSHPSGIAATLLPPPKGVLVLSTRRGLEHHVVEEVQAFFASSASQGGHETSASPSHSVMQKPGRVLVRGLAADRDLGALVDSVRCAEGWAVQLTGRPAELARGGQLEAAVIAALAASEVQQWLSAMTEGTVRYRIDWPTASRAQMWRLAACLREQCPTCVNDPTASQWELGVVEGDGQPPSLELRAKGRVDPRFAYRCKTVPASSHAPLAAALARVAGVRADDVVWDPFCGAGTELIERALLGPYASLWGTDLDAEARESALLNISHAGLWQASVTITSGDARVWADIRPTLVITNPPLGRRVARGQAREVIQSTAAHLAQLLAPGGRLVWISPFPSETREIFARAGLTLSYSKTVDLGGFDAELQRADKP